jgi:hypothetical protein
MRFAAACTRSIFRCRKSAIVLSAVNAPASKPLVADAARAADHLVLEKQTHRPPQTDGTIAAIPSTAPFTS